MTKSVVITGVSTGIGRACAEDLVARGWRVFGSVRKPEQAEALKAAFGDRFAPLIFDVTNRTEIAKAAEQVQEALGPEGTLAGLVNNAGIAVSGPLMHIDPEEIRTQLEINVMGPVLVTQAFLPLLGARENRPGEPGRVINMSSISGRRALPFLGPYSMSKFALESYSDSLRREMLLYGIKVVVVEPGPIVTPIWDKAEELDLTPYQHTDYAPFLSGYKDETLKRGRDGLPASKVADAVRKGLTLADPKLRYVVVKNKFFSFDLPSLIPDKRVDKIIGKMFGFIS